MNHCVKQYFVFIFLLLLSTSLFSQESDTDTDARKKGRYSPYQENIRRSGWYLTAQISPASYIWSNDYGRETSSWLYEIRNLILPYEWFSYGSNNLRANYLFSEDGYKKYHLLNRYELTNGYYFNDYFCMGLNTGFRQLYHAPYADAKINEAFVGLDIMMTAAKAKLAPYFNFAGGKNVVLQSSDQVYRLKGKYYANGGVGLRIYLVGAGFLLIEFEAEYTKTGFVDYYFEDVSFITFNSKIGFLF